MNTELLSAYRYHRQRRRTASNALALARTDSAAGTKRYTSASTRINPYNPRCSYFGGNHCRWIEDTHRAGLRRLGTAYEVSRRNNSRAIDHTGWYLDDYCDETASPAVFQLPARHGQPIYVYGYDDPYNDGAAFLCFDNAAETDMDAARYADQITQRMAEEERQHYRAWRAGDQYAQLETEIADTRAEIRALIAELRAVTLPKDGAICATLRSAIRAARSTITDNHSKRAQLLADYGDHPGFREHLPA